MDPLEPSVHDQIAATIRDNRVVLFMKGSPSFPQCGFSAAANKMLADVGLSDYTHVNVLENQAVREGIKLFSSWPTIPQLYVDQEFIGGADIMAEMYKNGALARLINK